MAMNMLPLVLLGSLLHVGCAEVAKPSAQSAEDSKSEIAVAVVEEPRTDEPIFAVESWNGTWRGDQPEYPMYNANGEPIVVRGMAANVKGSQFTFTIRKDGVASLQQVVDDGRIMNFEGTWKGQIDENQPPSIDASASSPRLRAIVCELAATDTGAYRQYALVVDTKSQGVRCIGTSSEPTFFVQLLETE